MKKRFSFAVLLTILMGLLPSSVAFSQTYTISPTGYTEKPYYQSLSNSWIGYTKDPNSIWIETKAVKSGSSVVFYVRKSSGTFQNNVSYIIRRDVKVSESTVTSEGTKVGSGSISAGKSSGTCTITPTSGSHEYRVILTSGSMTFYSRIVTIAVEAASPTKPSSPNPSNGATNVATSGTFSWSTTPNDGGSSISYDLYLDTNSSFSSSGKLYNSGQGKSCSYSNLKPGTKYYWKVIVYNSSGKSIWSDVWSFTTKEAASPTKPSSPNPSNGATNVATSGTFSWSTSPNDGGSTISYDLYLDTKSDFSSSGRLYNSGQGKSCSYSNLKPGTTYYWKVIVYNSSGKSTWSDAWSFTTKDVASPTKPSSPNPSNGATNVATSGTFSWSTSPNDGGSSISYDLYLDTKSDFSSSGRLYNSGQGKSCSYSNLKPGTTYYWKVIVYNSSGKSTWSDAWSFTTKSNEVATPTKPSSPSPSNGGTNVATTGTFSWSTSPNDGGSSISYDLYLDTKSDFSSSGRLYNSGQGKSCSYSGLKANTKYYWKVIVYNSSGGHIWSDAWSFTTQSESSETSTPSKPSSPTPSNGATNVSTSGTLSWNSSPNDGGSVLNYDLYLDTNSSFSNNKKPYSSGRGTSCIFSSLEAGTTYYWKVIVYNSSGKHIWSDVWSFSTNKNTTSLDHPDNTSLYASDISSTSFRANWNVVSGATGYDVHAKMAGDNSYSNAKTGATTANRNYYVFSGLTPNTRYVFQVRSTNDNQKSSYSKEFEVTTAKAQTKEADLKIVNENGFTVSKMYVGFKYHYVSHVYNNEFTPWTGCFYLKEGDKDIKPWSVTIPALSSVKLECDYTPTKEGEKTLCLYYQTAGTGSGIPVNKGKFNNPISVQAVNSVLLTYLLNLKGNITCTPSTSSTRQNTRGSSSITFGTKSTLSASVTNNGETNYQGRIFYTDNGMTIPNQSNQSISLSKGGDEKPLSCEWTPQSPGNHEISVQYEDNNGATKQIASTVFVVEEPEQTNGTRVVDEAKIDFITKDLAPKYVSEGDEVYYYFKITDSSGRPVIAHSLIFDCQNGKKSQVKSTLSDNNGIAILSIATEGSMAITNPGNIVTFKFNGIVDGNGNSQKVSSIVNTSALSMKLGIRESGLMESVESWKITLDRGLGAKTCKEFSSTFDVEGSLSFPLSLGFKAEDDGNMSVIVDSEMEGKLGGEFNFSDKLSGGAKGSFAYKEVTTYKPKTEDQYKKTAMAVVAQLASSFYLGTSARILESAMAIESWGSNKKKEGFFATVVDQDNTYSTEVLGLSLNVSYDFGKLNLFNLLPKKLTTTTKGFKLPTFSLDKFKAKGEVEFKWEPWKDKKQNGVDLRGSNRSLKLLVETSYNTYFNQMVSAKKSWWKRSNMGVFYNKFASYMNLNNAGGSHSVSVSVKEEEMYNQNKTVLKEISNTYGLETKSKYTFGDLKICRDWIPEKLRKDNNYAVKAYVEISSSLKNKMTSKGAFAEKLQNISNYTPEPALLYPSFTGKYNISNPLDHLAVLNRDLEFYLKAISKGQNYDIKEAMKIELQNSSKGKASVSVPIARWGIIDFTVDLGLAFELENYPSISYYSTKENSFFPIVLRSSSSLPSLVEAMTNRLKERLSNTFSEKEKKEITYTRDAVVGAGSTMPTDGSTLLIYNDNIHINMENNSQAGIRAKTRTPALAEKRQTDICTFSFTIEGNNKDFANGTDISSHHFYPAGYLLGETDCNDTLFVVSEVFELSAINANDTLQKAPYGFFKLDTHIGADDLTPFGFSEDMPLDIYHSRPGSDIWHYVGPAGTSVMVDSLGSYIMATSIKNDIINPEIVASFDHETGIIYLNVKDNIGIRINSLKVFVDGSLRSVNAVNESNYYVQLEPEELDHRIEFYAIVYDIAGNIGEVMQMFQIDKPEIVNIENLPDTDISQLENTIYIGNVSAEKGKDMTLSVKMKNSVVAEGFQFDLELPEGVTVAKDADGFAEAYLSTERTSSRKTNTFDADFEANGALRVMAGSTNGSTISGNDGEVATIKLNVASSVAEGSYPIVLRNISISDSNAKSYDVELVKSTLTVTGVLGDVDGDGYVTKADVTALTDYIMGRNPESFNYNNANINRDFNVDVADLVLLLNMVQ